MSKQLTKSEVIPKEFNVSSSEEYFFDNAGKNVSIEVFKLKPCSYKQRTVISAETVLGLEADKNKECNGESHLICVNSR